MAHGLLRIVHSPVRDIKAHFLQQASCGVGTDRIDWYADSERVCVLSCFQREARGVILDSGGDGGGGEDGMNDVEELFAFCVSEYPLTPHTCEACYTLWISTSARRLSRARSPGVSRRGGSSRVRDIPSSLMVTEEIVSSEGMFKMTFRNHRHRQYSVSRSKPR